MTGSEIRHNLKYCFAILGYPSPFLENQIAGLGLSHISIHKIPFIDAEDREEWLLWKVRSHELKVRVGIGAGAAGCAIGHVETWKTFKSCEHDYLIVLEDDARITKYGERHLKYVIAQFSSSKLQLVHLGDHIKFNSRNLFSCIFKLQIRDFFRLIIEHKIFIFFKPKFVLNQFPFSGHAYAISREIADIITTSNNLFLFPIDVFLNSISQVPQNMVARIRTPLIVQSNLRESQIELRGR